METAEEICIQRSEKALDKIRAQFELENARLAIITPDLYQEVYNLLKQHMLHDEPLCKLIESEWSDEFETIIYEHLKQNVSLCFINEETKEIMAIRITGIESRTNPPHDPSHLTDEKLKTLLQFLSHRDEEVDMFNRLGVDKVMVFFGLCVAPKFRKRHIGTRLFNVAVAFGKELGIKGIRGEGSSRYSQKIYEKAGFECVVSMQYRTYVTSCGKPLSDGSGEHTDAKVYVMNLS